MNVLKAYLEHLTGSSDLVTTYEETRAGFVTLALEKNRRATPYVEEARNLMAAASKAKSPEDLLKMSDIQIGLFTAAGLSEKAMNHLQPEDKTRAVRELIEKYLKSAGNTFVEELVFRFLLTRGDALGGSMRNVGGVFAERKLARATIANLTLSGRSYSWFHGKSKKWIQGTRNDPDIELDLKSLSWVSGGKKRTMIYNRRVPFMKNNVDFCLFGCPHTELTSEILKNPKKYVALGELKGGIDPAGADEHWKTAGTALSRIRDAFSQKGFTPHLFFVGAAIEASMAEEIWRQLENGQLSNAANLTDSKQLASLCRWLCNL